MLSLKKKASKFQYYTKGDYYNYELEDYCSKKGSKKDKYFKYDSSDVHLKKDPKNRRRKLKDIYFDHDDDYGFDYDYDYTYYFNDDSEDDSFDEEEKEETYKRADS
ncbi:hypothetical protein CEXT_515451 [Caerostris extrusa]|uniref:Uncharacterized protein n=1 Tax=Caerostris extrusa TaxID=172846 RepID=A0AAV4Q4E5_CAEEX|nr:hypothetical protein CEXT_515451 [Caerostris extrusa]